MSRIRLLPDFLVNQIAAGEVVERPAAALKELIDNALDAGATYIEIRLAQGGIGFLQVSDNGCGMSANDLQMAVQRHATSKLPEDHLNGIEYFGFRGEALPAIGAVSRLQLASRTANDDHAWQLQIAGGTVAAPEPAQHPVGTTVTVQDLFYAVPARLKFLRSPQTEWRYCREMIERIALGNPQTAFRVWHDDKKILDWPMTASAAARLPILWGNQLAQGIMNIEREAGSVRLHGHLAHPHQHQATPAMQYTYVNGRPVRDRLLQAAIKVAVGDLVPHGRHLPVALWLNVPPSAVDVNVHPAKSEVRFRDPDAMRGFIINSLRQAFNQHGLAMGLPAQVGSFKFKNNTSLGLADSVQQHGFEFAPGGRTSSNFPHPELAEGWKIDSSESSILLQAQNEDFGEKYPLGAALAQLHRRYILAQNATGLIMVDQHAAHERLVYEEIKLRLELNELPLQPLLLPMPVSLVPAQTDNLLAAQEGLLQLGIGIAAGHGSDQLIVHTLPNWLKQDDAPAMLADLANLLEEVPLETLLTQALHRLAATIACHGSVRSGRSLNQVEMNALLRQIEACPAALACNHGRPTYRAIALDELDQWFAR